MSPQKCLQETYAAHSTCYGCGPSNPKGLHVRSFPEGELVVAEWKAEPHQEAFPGVLNGGIVGSILDCHSNWTAAYSLMKAAGDNHPPCTVTAEYTIKLLAPTSCEKPLRLEAKVAELKGDRAIIEAKLIANGKVTATCRGTFVAVKPGHPAYHRW